MLAELTLETNDDTLSVFVYIRLIDGNHRCFAVTAGWIQVGHHEIWVVHLKIRVGRY